MNTGLSRKGRASSNLAASAVTSTVPRSYVLTLALLNELVFEPFEREMRVPEIIYVNAVDFADLRKTDIWGVMLRTMMDGKRIPLGMLCVEDDRGERQRMCLRCKSLIEDSYCQSDLCTIMDVQES